MAFVIWGVGLMATMALQWDQLQGPSLSFQNAPEPPSPLLGTLAVGLTQTWGYLLVAVVAFAASAVITASVADDSADLPAPDPTDDDD